ncbi:hypothetical protein LCGC14_1382150 [marine sediment metagenome]|uniref:Uncharacterized protein n=1 Tax=marine sediment metagenome TaxID=412755 RepID=A0A0F9N403_9ZZZZ
MTTKTGTVHFKTGKGFARLMMELTRQAYWMEDRQEWALDTLACLQGLTVEQAKAILSGMARLEDGEEENTTILLLDKDEQWIEKLAEYQKWQEDRTYLFGNRRVPKDLVDFYTGSLVSRLRATLRMGFVADPLETMDLERQRRDTHNEILQVAGFNKIDTIRYDYDDLEFAEFDRAFQKHLNRETGSLFADSDSDEEIA